MNYRERENATLSFQSLPEGGSVEETFGPWDLTLERWRTEGLGDEAAENVSKNNLKLPHNDIPFNGFVGDGCYHYEKHLGFDGVMRLFLYPPFSKYQENTIKETAEYILRQDNEGLQWKENKQTGVVEEYSPSPEEAWAAYKEGSVSVIEEFYNPENIKKILEHYRDGHQRGDYPVRLFLCGFFEFPRRHFGIEGHLYAFYDYPELMHEMNEFLLNFYFERLPAVLEVLPPDVLYLMEDLSGKNGPMLSPALFDEFVGSYYKRLVPFLKQKGVRHVFIDTDGDFTALIPNFIDSGIDGFLPMDVNAGMDIVAVRQKFPRLKFIGGFNKLAIAAGKEAIDKEFERLLPVIRQGGYIPGCDHQVAPSTAFDNYLYYIKRLKEVMKEAGNDI